MAARDFIGSHLYEFIFSYGSLVTVSSQAQCCEAAAKSLCYFFAHGQGLIVRKPLYTPGPWYARHRRLVRVYPMGGVKPICGIHRNGAAKGDPEEAEAFANANLIAAAPDMYEALKLLRDAVEDSTILSKIDASIAKAEGIP
jgi:hypothetical protein